MGVRIVVHEHAPGDEPYERDGAEEVEHAGPAAGYELYDEPAQEVRQNGAELYACKRFNPTFLPVHTNADPQTWIHRG